MINQLQFPILVVVVGAVSGIMVPTGKIGPITPAKVTPSPINGAASRIAAPVWERVDESGSQYSPPVYKYTLWEFVQKYGHHTLIPRYEDYYNPPQRVTYQQPIYNKANAYYSPHNFL